MGVCGQRRPPRCPGSLLGGEPRPVGHRPCHRPCHVSWVTVQSLTPAGSLLEEGGLPLGDRPRVLPVGTLTAGLLGQTTQTDTGFLASVFSG